MTEYAYSHGRHMRPALIAGLGGVEEEAPVYSALLTIRGQEPLLAEAAEFPGEDFVIIGRDVLNHFKLTLDGPNRKLVLERP